MERYQYLAQLEAQLYEAVPPIDPPNVYWLTSESSASYCRECAQIARGEEFDLGRPLTPSRWRETPLELAFQDGIDGGFEGSGTDTPEQCETCGLTLQYYLTDYGVEQELAHFAQNPGFTSVGPEDTYVISRICLNLTYGNAPAEQVEAAIVIVKDAILALIEKEG